jgi:hypothetical protein
MHGIIFAELEKHVDTEIGPTVWPMLLKRAGIASALKVYLPITSYPDEEFTSLIQAAAEHLNVHPQVFLETFGERLVPGLMATYAALIHPAWKTLDLVEAYDSLYQAATHRNSRYTKPMVVLCTRDAPNELTVSYESERRLCRLAQGVIRGIALHYSERIEIVEEACMYQGAPACIMKLVVDRPPSRRPSSTGYRAVKP